MKNKYIDDYYNCVYSLVHYKGLLGKFNKSYHKLLENDNCSNNGLNILEIGAGNGEHFYFVAKDYQSYILTDLNTKSLKTFVNQIDSGYRGRVSVVKCNAEKLPFKRNTFDRVIVTCVLHHIGNIDTALTEIRRVVKSGGEISVYLPCDPGMFYRYIRHFVSHKKQKEIMGTSMKKVKYLWALEHKNHLLGILFVIKKIFILDNVLIKRYPIPKFSWNFNLFFIVKISVRK
jgi:ubiquinone/menaquinone biosynthesis C-methylase UbiE